MKRPIQFIRTQSGAFVNLALILALCIRPNQIRKHAEENPFVVQADFAYPSNDNDSATRVLAGYPTKKTAEIALTRLLTQMDSKPDELVYHMPPHDFIEAGE